MKTNSQTCQAEGDQATKYDSFTLHINNHPSAAYDNGIRFENSGDAEGYAKCHHPNKKAIINKNGHIYSMRMCDETNFLRID